MEPDMKRMILFVFICLTLMVSACGRKGQQLTLLTEEYPPLTFAGSKGPSGFAVEVVKEIQKALKSDAPITLLEWDSAYQRAVREPNIVLFTMERTPERDSLFYWVGPLGEHITYLYVPKDSDLNLASVEDAKKLPLIGTVKNWFSEQFLVKQGFANLSSSTTPGECLKQLMQKKVEAAAFTDLTIGRIAEEAGYSSTDAKPTLELLRTEYYIAISKGTDQKIVDAWQKAFQSLETEGALDKLRNKWLTGREVAIALK